MKKPNLKKFKSFKAMNNIEGNYSSTNSKKKKNKIFGESYNYQDIGNKPNKEDLAKSHKWRINERGKLKSKNETINPRLRHMDIKYHHIWELIKKITKFV